MALISSAGQAASPAYEIYTVVEGDSLWGIAAARLGSGARHVEIRAPNGLSSNTLFTGQQLKIPK
ncbi:MAG: LysM peptidoglycan-binding domain-containing protein [Dethiobacter sp.]|nr:LysM peptidoglycan-binding domain-containing protein [Dethiobacter sp.]MBS4054920.1 LysM peptidoglycan-binding domain-containing protein [Thermaerobacter sp.]